MSPLASLAVFASPTTSSAATSADGSACVLRISTRYPDIRNIAKNASSPITKIDDRSGDQKWEFEVPCQEGLEFLKSDDEKSIVCDTIPVDVRRTEIGLRQGNDVEVSYFHRVCSGYGLIQADLPFTSYRVGNRKEVGLGRGVSIEYRF